MNLKEQIQVEIKSQLGESDDFYLGNYTVLFYHFKIQKLFSLVNLT